jgi:hypothetical protein
MKVTNPPQVDPLLPEPIAVLGGYVVPFVSIMVPREGESYVLDQFNNGWPDISLSFLILKEGLGQVAPEWLSTRKYLTGEINAYVDESGHCSTELRTKARLVITNLTKTPRHSLLNIQPKSSSIMTSGLCSCNAAK